MARSGPRQASWWDRSGQPCGALLTPSVSEFPNDGVVSTLSDVLEPWHEGLRRYCLSSRAAKGIVRRAERRGRELPEPLRTALTTLAALEPDEPTDDQTDSEDTEQIEPE